MAYFLVVDDDQPFREMLGAGLRTAGHTVSFAKSGSEALQWAEMEPPDIVVTDIVMPHGDGIELLVGLRKSRPDLPIIAMSGTSLHSTLYLRTAQLLGAQQTLLKPFTMEHFFEVVNAVITSPNDAQLNCALAGPGEESYRMTWNRITALKERVARFDEMIAGFSRDRKKIVERRAGAADHVMVELDDRLAINSRALEAMERSRSLALDDLKREVARGDPSGPLPPA
jgi:CheY-like chemotaxis protein